MIKTKTIYFIKNFLLKKPLKMSEMKHLVLKSMKQHTLVTENQDLNLNRQFQLEKTKNGCRQKINFSLTNATEKLKTKLNGNDFLVTLPSSQTKKLNVFERSALDEKEKNCFDLHFADQLKLIQLIYYSVVKNLEKKETNKKDKLKEVTEKKKKKKYLNSVILISSCLSLIKKNLQIEKKNKKKVIGEKTLEKGFLHVILTLNNIFIFTKINKKTILNLSTGQLGFKNTKKNLFTTAWLLGRTASEFLLKQVNWNQLNHKRLIVHNASSNNYRLKFVLRGFKDNGLKFSTVSFVNKISFNGCKKKHLGRTGRKRKVFFS